MSLTPGSRLGPYEVLAPLGAGGMGVVHRARDPRLGREVAIKALPAGTTSDPDRLARFRREAQLLASLNHPNIATLYGLEESGGAPHLVLELVEGETLAARIARGPLPLADAVATMVQVAAAVEAAHERGVIHRDLKPGNVMLTPAGVVKVLDFGLARVDAAHGDSGAIADSPTRTVELGGTVPGMILGTAAYMSPEQARGRPVDRRSDVWSFGCLLYECLTGRAAFTGDTVPDLIARILEREPDWSALPEGVPGAVREVLRRCLRRESDARPRDIRDVRIELSDAVRPDARGGDMRTDAIAVLPFENLSGPDDEYFADGVTDEILNALAQVRGLRVAARTSSFAFKGRREDLRVVGEKLGVGTVLEGTVRRAGPRLRVTVRLVQVSDGYQNWSERYDRELTDVFELQDEIARTIAARLSGQEGDAAAGTPRGTRDLEAYDLFLRGRALLHQRGRHIVSAMSLFEAALARDPAYAEAMALLADGHRLHGTFNLAPAHEVMPRARAMAERALALRPGEPEALATLATVMAQYGRDADAAESLWQQALVSQPRHTRSRGERSTWLMAHGRMRSADAVTLSRAALADDPLNSWMAAQCSLMHYFHGDFSQAVAAGRHALALDSESFVAQWHLLSALIASGGYVEVTARVPQFLSSSGRHSWALGTHAWLAHAQGHHEQVRAIRDEVEARARFEYLGSTWRAALACMAGDTGGADRLIGLAAEEHDPMLLFTRLLLPFRPLVELPALRALAGRLWP